MCGVVSCVFYVCVDIMYVYNINNKIFYNFVSFISGSSMAILGVMISCCKFLVCLSDLKVVFI